MPNFEALAKIYQVSARTVRRWHVAGVPVEDALAVAIHLCGIRHPAPAAIGAATQLLKSELETLTP